MARARETVDDKGTRYLTEGRVSVYEARRDLDTDRVTQAVVFVRGRGDEPYRVTTDGWAWWCDCPAYVDRCAHVAAAQKVLGWSPTTERPSVRVPSELDALFATDRS